MTPAELATEAEAELKAGNYQSAQTTALVAIAGALAGGATPETPQNRSGDDPAGGNDALSQAAGHRDGLKMAVGVANAWCEEHLREGSGHHLAIAKELDRLAEYLDRLSEQAAKVAALSAFTIAACRRGCGRPVIARGEHCNTRECEQAWLATAREDRS